MSEASDGPSTTSTVSSSGIPGAEASAALAEAGAKELLTSR
ncbi:hypothetical protein [Streptomyces albidoflavus]|nr:hypothetical protein [Streptomyces albidoflavus]